MGDYIEVVVLGGEYYLEYQNEGTDWVMKTKKLSKDQTKAIQDHQQKQREESDKFLKAFI